MQTILGANGTIGTELAKELRVYTDKIRLVSRNPKKINPDDELHPADLSDSSQVENAVAGSSVVYLLVGFDYKASIWEAKWPPLMRSVIDACKKHQCKLVFFDNVYLYAPTAIPHMTEESPIGPKSRKGAVRAAIAGMLMDEVRAGTLTALIARAADFYGPNNQKSMLIETVYNNFKKGKKADWLIGVDFVHSFTYTPDAAKATALLGNTTDAFNQVWHLPTDSTRLTGKDWINLFANTMKAKPAWRLLPKWLMGVLGLFIPIMKELKEMTYQYDQDYFFDSSKFEKRFGWKATKPEDGVKETVG